MMIILKVLRFFPLLPLLLWMHSEASAQLLPDNLALSQEREILSVPQEFRIQSNARNDGLDLIVWGSTMNEGERAHPVLYFAILLDSIIVVHPARLTDLESWPNSFLQVLPLSGRWMVLWTNDTGTRSRTEALLVDSDGTFSRPFQLWEGHPVTQHGAKVVRMESRDFICWSDTGRIETVGRWLDRREVVPEPRIIVDSGYLFLTRDYCSSIDGGLIETSTGKHHRVSEGGSVKNIDIPAFTRPVDTYNIDSDCAIYTARQDTIRYYASILDQEPKVSATVEIESWLTTAPVTRIHVYTDGEIAISTLLKPEIRTRATSTEGLVTAVERRYLLDDNLEVLSDSTIELPWFYARSLHTHPLEYPYAFAGNVRFADNGSSRSFRVTRSSYDLVVPVLFGDFPTNRISEFNGVADGAVVFGSPFTLLPAPSVRREVSEAPRITFATGGVDLVLTSAAATVSMRTIDQIPRLTRLGDRLYASWYSYGSDTMLVTSEIIRTSQGEVYPGRIHVSDSLNRRGGITARNLVSTGPVAVQQIRAIDSAGCHLYLRTLQPTHDSVTWETVYAGDVQGDTCLLLGRSYCDPDGDMPWLNIYTTIRVAYDDYRLIGATALRLSPEGRPTDTVELVVPHDSTGMPYEYRKVEYLPINEEEYLITVDRTYFLRATKSSDVDTLAPPIGTLGLLSPYFGDRIIERVAGGEYPGTHVYDLQTGAVEYHRVAGVSGAIGVGYQNLYRSSDSATVLIYSTNSGVYCRTYDLRAGTFSDQLVTYWIIHTFDPAGLFTRDTLWVVYEAIASGKRQVYLNALILSPESSGVEGTTFDQRDVYGLRYYPDGLLIQGADAGSSGFIVDMRGRIADALTPAQIRGESLIDTTLLPSGTYAILICHEGCTTATFQIVH